MCPGPLLFLEFDAGDRLSLLSALVIVDLILAERPRILHSLSTDGDNEGVPVLQWLPLCMIPFVALLSQDRPVIALGTGLDAAGDLQGTVFFPETGVQGLGVVHEPRRSKRRHWFEQQVSIKSRQTSSSPQRPRGRHQTYLAVRRGRW
ncbi:hypothetical protein Micbo1qcDRAFT_50094 [Microdochium bolleyi]|uniref:Uncharacterized protein n=1 Tax=Microdochium bolleyi TaxID=196109 RepID=A0A136J636_9PEZI|nr:hypothetical protein Micbo1qcDRAFT_50094 [Microdochium bolleyi]